MEETSKNGFHDCPTPFFSLSHTAAAPRHSLNCTRDDGAWMVAVQVAAMKAMPRWQGTPVGIGMTHTAVRCASVLSFAASLRVLGSAQRGREQFASEIITIWAPGWQQYRTSRWMRRPQVRSPRAACARRGSQTSWEICVGAEPKVRCTLARSGAPLVARALCG